MTTDFENCIMLRIVILMAYSADNSTDDKGGLIWRDNMLLSDRHHFCCEVKLCKNKHKGKSISFGQQINQNNIFRRQLKN